MHVSADGRAPGRRRGSRLRLLLALLASAALLAALAGPAFADREYSWTLDKDAQQLRSPLPYLYDFEIDGMYKPSGTFKNPADIFIDKQFNIWIADTGNNRVLKFDEAGTFLREYGTDENDGKLNAPEGIYISDRN